MIGSSPQLQVLSPPSTEELNNGHIGKQVDDDGFTYLRKVTSFQKDAKGNSLIQ